MLKSNCPADAILNLARSPAVLQPSSSSPIDCIPASQEGTGEDGCALSGMPGMNVPNRLQSDGEPPGGFVVV